MNEFNEKYEIIEQDWKIYTVREREWTNVSVMKLYKDFVM
jgi:hypothetical protein